MYKENQNKKLVYILTFIVITMMLCTLFILIEMKSKEISINERITFLSSEITYDIEDLKIIQNDIERNSIIQKSSNSIVFGNLSASKYYQHTVPVEIVCQRNGVKLFVMNFTSKASYSDQEKINITINSEDNYTIYAHKRFAEDTSLSAVISNDLYKKLFKAMWYSFEINGVEYKVNYRGYLRITGMLEGLEYDCI